MSVLNLPGPAFLAFYFAAFVVALILAGILRFILRTSNAMGFSLEESVSPSEAAYLQGGQSAVVRSSIARLVHEKALEFDLGTQTLVPKQSDPPRDGSELDRAVFTCITTNIYGSKNMVPTIEKKIPEPLANLREQMEEKGLVLTWGQTLTAQLVPMLFPAAVIVLGLMKFFVGFSRNRPVGFLIAALAVSCFLLIALFGRSFHRTRRGDALLKRLQKENAALKTQAQSRSDSLSGVDLALAVALFGGMALVGSPLEALHRVLLPTPTPSGGGCGGACGTTSCGGSCGGGCGGGCGGCGG